MLSMMHFGITCAGTEMHRYKWFAAYIGLDWSDKKHDFYVQIGDVETRYYCVIEHKPEANEQYLHNLHNEVKVNIAVCLSLIKPLLCMPSRSIHL